MIFPFPKIADDWQAAYSRKMAYTDSEKRASAFILSLAFGLPVVIFAVIRLLYLLIFGGYPGWGWDLVNILIIATLFVVAVAGAFRFASSFLSKFYLPPENIDPLKIINFRLFGIQKPMMPLDTLSQSRYIIAKDGVLEKKDEWPSWMACNIGGPLLLVVFDGCALYLERGNRFSRVVGPAEQLPFLEQYETIKYVVDLRPKVKSGDITVWTKDGIKITLTIKITCRIGDPAKKDPAGKLVYPFDPVAVKKAIERYAVRWPKDQKDPSEFTWLHAAWGQVTGIIPGFIGARSLDDLLIADRQSGQILSPTTIQTIFQALNQATNQFGVYIIDFQVLKMEPPEKVKEQHKNNWEAERQSIATIIDGRAKAFSIRTSEEARAEAQRNLILAIAEGLKKNQSKQFAEPLLLSLSGILDESLQDPLARSYLAKESLDTLEKLQKLLDQD